MQTFLVYAFVREDGTFYYIGKGTRRRPYIKRRKGVKPPSDKSQIIILHDNLNEETALEYEKRLILFYGRKDKGEGLLRNMTDGGEGTSGWKPHEEWRKNKSESMKGSSNPFFGKQHNSETMNKILEKRKTSCLNRRLGNIDEAFREQVGTERALQIYQSIEKSERQRQSRLKGKRKDETNPMFGVLRQDVSERNTGNQYCKGLKFVNNGKIELRLLPSEIPEGFKLGRLRPASNAKPIKVTNMSTGEELFFSHAGEAVETVNASARTIRRAATLGKPCNANYFVEFIDVAMQSQ